MSSFSLHRRAMTLLAALFSTLMLVAGAQGATDPFKSTVTTKDEFLPVDEAYQLSAAVDIDRVLLRWQIADGYYLYRHQFGFKTAEGAALNADLPSGKAKVDEYFGAVEVYYHALDVTVSGIPQQPFTLAVTAQGCADAGLCYPPNTRYLAIDPIAKTAEFIAKPATASTSDTKTKSAPTETNTGSWLAMLLLAALGGSILNLMPCVFPVLSLKVLGFASHHEKHQAWHGMAYTAGVVLSFLLVAVILLALKAAGQAVGWGFQLQQPWFVGALAYLFFAMGLSLSGFWELGGSWMGLGNNLATRPGYSGSFFTGVLATLVASPCTAPFMGSALGYAATQSAPKALAVFAALGFGMALPMSILCLSPKLLAYVPKPGMWMERFKQALAFPLYATAIWLCWVVGRQGGATAMAAILLGALILTLGLWLWRFGLIGRSVAAAGFALALAILAGPWLSASKLETQTTSREWQPYSEQALADLRTAGKPVFLNVTADWCITCLTNEKVALSSAAVKTAFAQNGITYMKADWTHYDEVITKLLARFGRNGIPLYVFFPADKNAEPIVLPQLLRPSTVVDAVSNPNS